MSTISHTALMYLTDIEMLELILEDCQQANRKPFRGAYGARSTHVDRALVAAYKVLPEGKGKRALDYVISHPCAEFYFGGTDAVGPAIREGLDILKKQRLQDGIEKSDSVLYRHTA